MGEITNTHKKIYKYKQNAQEMKIPTSEFQKVHFLVVGPLHAPNCHDMTSHYMSGSRLSQLLTIYIKTIIDIIIAVSNNKSKNNSKNNNNIKNIIVYIIIIINRVVLRCATPLFVPNLSKVPIQNSFTANYIILLDGDDQYHLARK